MIKNSGTEALQAYFNEHFNPGCQIRGNIFNLVGKKVTIHIKNNSGGPVKQQTGILHFNGTSTGFILSGQDASGKTVSSSNVPKGNNSRGLQTIKLEPA